MYPLIIAVFLVAVADGIADLAKSRSAQMRLYDELLRDYEPLVRPAGNVSVPVLVSLGLDFQQIVDIVRPPHPLLPPTRQWLENEYEGYMETNAWMKFGWKDVYMTWDPALYGGLTEIRLPVDKIWKPDILMYNSANIRFDSTYPSNIIIYSDGSVTWIPPGVLKSSCKIDVTWFPFDDQKCEMKFGSWSYHGYQIDLAVGDISTATYTVSGEWSLISVTGQRNVVKYACCPEPYLDVTFVVWIRRRTLYYHLNLVIPCLLVSSLALFGFFLPPNSGERIVLGITVFMALCITMMQTTDSMPKLSDAIPLISVFFTAVNVVVILQVVLTVVVLNYFYRSPGMYDMPHWMGLLFLKWLPRFVLMEPRWKTVPSDKTIAKRGSVERPLVAKYSGKTNSSKSLLANVLDLEDFTLPRPTAEIYADVKKSEGWESGREEDVTGDCGRHPSPPTVLSAVLAEVKFITGRMQREAFEREQLGDWIFAARVLDRFSLLLCTSALIFGITRVLVQAPHIIA